MEDETILKNDKSSSLVPALGLLGLGVGVIALALGVLAMVKVGDTAKQMNDKIEKAAALSLETKKISDRIDSIALQIESVKGDEKSRLETLAAQINNEFRKVYSTIDDTRTNVSENRKAIEEVAKRSTSPRRAQQQATAPKQDEKPAPDTAQKQEAKPEQAQQAAENSDVKTHVIQSGDTFGKLTKIYKVSLDAIVKANPGVNPSRLRIGQKIVIPAK